MQKVILCSKTERIRVVLVRYSIPLSKEGGFFMKKTVTSFLLMKEKSEKITMITAYDYPSASTVEAAKADMILVGDSLGMVVLGYDSTIPVTVDDMIHHAKAVRRGARNTFVVVDMPFMSYHVSKEETLKNAMRIFQETNCDALKVEGADEVLEVISSLTKAGIPVVAHLGLTPQSVGVLGGYKVQGRDAAAAKKLLDDAKACEKAGASSIVLECVPYQLAEVITKELSIPTIGIGAGAVTDGQVLVYHDVIGYGTHHIPKFVKRYENITSPIVDALTTFVEEVKSNQFPLEEHSFTMKEEELNGLYGGNK